MKTHFKSPTCSLHLSMSRKKFAFSVLAGLFFFMGGLTSHNQTIAFADTPDPTQTLVTQTPPASETLPVFSEFTETPELDWDPPSYEVPLALNVHDHFFFVKPIAADTNNWPLEDYRYGYLYPNEDIAHTGVDISSPMDKPVLASAAGTVVFTGYGLLYGANNLDDPYGMAVVIRHNFSYQDYTIFSVYAHLGSINVEKGDWVETGDQIGVIGMTGNTSGPHVHFEIRLENDAGDKVQNPELWIAPPIGYGVIAGRVTNNHGSLITAKNIKLESADSDRVWTIYTYAPKTKQADDYYHENFAAGDIPAGEYKISMEYNGKVYEAPVTIIPGAVNYVKFHGTDGFVQELPQSPDPSEFLQ